MAVNFYIGRAGVGKTHHMISEIGNEVKEHPIGSNIIMIVPEQMSFQTEYEFVKTPGMKSIIRLQILSLKRLAYRVLQETGGIAKYNVGNEALVMMLTKIIRQQKDNLKVFKTMSGKYSFSEELASSIKEFKKYMVNPMDLMDLSNKTTDKLLNMKLHDLSLVYSSLQKSFGEKYVDNEDFFNMLLDNIDKSTLFDDTTVYIDGFHMFTKQELEIIKKIIKKSKDCNIALTMDHPNIIKNNSDLESFFNLPYKIYKNLEEFLKIENIEYNIKFYSNLVSPRFRNNQLKYLENNFTESNPKQYNKDNENYVEIFAASDRRYEVNEVARDILYKVKNEGYRYNEFAIYTNNQTEYYELIDGIFNNYDIPVFLDQRYKLINFAVVNFIDGTLEMIEKDFSYESVFRVLKTEVFMPLIYEGTTLTSDNYEHYAKKYRKRVDILENYCLAYGKRGSAWDDDYWEYNSMIKINQENIKTDKDIELEKIINETKDEFTNFINPFKKSFKDAETVKEKIIILYQLLEDLEISQKITLYQETVEDINLAKRYGQLWDKIIELFEELVEVSGDDILSTAEIIEVLRKGINGLEFSIIPPSLDQVYVGTLKRSRFQMIGTVDDFGKIGIRHAYVVGVNEGEIPLSYNDSNLISEYERNELNSNGITLAPSLEETTNDEMFIIYTVLTCPSDGLTLSYSLMNNDGKAIMPSSLINKINTMFPSCNRKDVVEAYIKTDETTKYVSTASRTASDMLVQLSYRDKGYDIDELWMMLKRYFEENHQYHNHLTGLDYKNIANNLNETTIKDLYNNDIEASVSRIELFNKCSFAHFMNYGIKLQERDKYEVRTPDIGDFYHESLRQLAEYIINSNRSWHDLSDEEIHQIIDKITDDLAKQLNRNIFNKDDRNKYLLYKLRRVLLKTILAIKYQSSNSSFKTVAVEEEFGRYAKLLKQNETSLKNDFNYSLKGVIDRVDLATNGKNAYFRVVDYKSSFKNLDLEKVYHGLSLQLLTYLDVVLENGDKFTENDVLPAGVFYFHVHNPIIDIKNELELSTNTGNTCIQEYKLSGYNLKSIDAIQLSDNNIFENRKSEIIPVKLKKDDSPDSNSKLLSQDDISTLRKYVRNSIENSVEEIFSGDVGIKPIIFENENACNYCSFKAICKFDDRNPENHYNKLSKIKNKGNLIEIMKEELGGGSNE